MLHPNVIVLMERYGNDFSLDIIWHRSVCAACSGRMKVCGGMFVKRL